MMRGQRFPMQRYRRCIVAALACSLALAAVAAPAQAQALPSLAAISVSYSTAR
jgi:uncharacterized membrane protein